MLFISIIQTFVVLFIHIHRLLCFLTANDGQYMLFYGTCLGNDIPNESIDGPAVRQETCFDRCNALPECISFNIDYNGCYPKDGMCPSGDPTFRTGGGFYFHRGISKLVIQEGSTPTREPVSQSFRRVVQQQGSTPTGESVSKSFRKVLLPQGSQ